MTLDDAAERVAMVLEGEPWRDTRHGWTWTIDLPWLVLGFCAGCGCVTSVSRGGLLFIERTPTSMVYRTHEPAACVRVAPRVERPTRKAVRHAAA